MPHVACILCGSEAEFSVSKHRPATYDSPAEGGDIDDMSPSCECVHSPCVDEGKYWELMDAAALDSLSSFDPQDDGDYAYECSRDR